MTLNDLERRRCGLFMVVSAKRGSLQSQPRHTGCEKIVAKTLVFGDMSLAVIFVGVHPQTNVLKRGT